MFENIESVLETIREVLREVDTKATHPVRAASERILFLMAHPPLLIEEEKSEIGTFVKDYNYALQSFG